MTDLPQERCTACHKDAPRATKAEIAELQPQIPEWNLIEKDGVNQLERVYHFADFVEALAFTNKVGALAEEEGHHPILVTQWGHVTVTWWTHAINNLHRNDFIMAAKTDAAAAEA